MSPRPLRPVRHRSRHRVAARAGVVAVAAALAAAGTAGPASAAPAPGSPVPGSITLTAEQVQQVQAQLAARGATGRPEGLPAGGPATLFLEVGTPAAAQAYADALPQGREKAGQASRAAGQRARAAADQLAARVPGAARDAAVLFSSSTALSGVAVRADVADYDALAALPGVTAVRVLTPKEPSNTGAASVVQAVQAWKDLGNTGKGVRIGIIDTGIDYTHADFGGSGSVAQFEATKAAEAAPAPGLFPSTKVAGGYDFVGNAYNAANAATAVPKPDPNPLDCNGHGSHVAGTAAGYGVTADGKTYTGGYSNVPGDLRIGPGMAPDATLYALKVFGCEGSTNATMQAINWALDPNGDGDLSDHLDVVNMSLGSDYGLADDADSVAADNAMRMGMLMVMSAGNAGDSYDIGGSPGNAPRGIGVAASNDGYGVFDGWEVTSPAGVVDGIRPGLRSVAYSDTDATGATKPDLTGVLVAAPAGNEDACQPIDAGYATGKVLLIDANGFACGSVAKSGNALEAGAIGFVIVSDDDLLETGITGSATIPGILTTKTDGTALHTAVAAGTQVTVHFGPSLKDKAIARDPAQVDLAASFTSRGTRQADAVKPDVAAPGVTLYSAAVGTGSQGISESGTSMAAPTTTGVTALIRKAHPDWTTEEVKADLVNTAVHDVHTADGVVYGPNRVGAGRIDAAAALRNDVLAYAQAGSGVVSASFGVVEVAQDRATATRTVTLSNKGGRAGVYRIGYEAAATQPGVSISVSPDKVTVPPGQTRQVTVTMTAVRDQLRKVGDPTVETADGRQFLGEASGRLVFTPNRPGDPALRVPVHVNAKPSSTLVASGNAAGDTITLAGRGVADGPAYRPTSYTSLVSAFEQLGTSPVMPKCATPADVAAGCYKSELERSVDLAAVGAAAVTLPEGPGVAFAVASYGIATSPQTAVNHGVFIDADGDRRWDYQVTTTRIDDYDLPLVVVTDRSFALLPKGAPYIGALNVADGTVDTNTFDNDVQVLAAPLSVMPLAKGRVSFGVESASAYGTVDDLGTTQVAGLPELSGPMSFDPTRPGLSFTTGGGEALLSVATGGTTIGVTQDPASYAADARIGASTPGALVVLHQNDGKTGRYQSVPVAVRQPATTG